VPQPGKKPDWQTETRYPLQPRNLWQKYQDPKTLVGLRFGDETRYTLIDIDRDSAYHPANNYSGFKDVLAALEEIGLCRPLVVQSSNSGGLHIYYFLPEPLPTFPLACAVKFALEDADLQLRSGQLEAFPNVKAYSKGKPSDYNGHRLPLQVGSYLLDEHCQPLSDNLAQFLDAADVTAAHQDVAALQTALAAAKERHKLKYIPGTSNKAQEWKRHLEERIAEGWTGRGQTNELLKDFAVYGIVWQALNGDALIDYVEATAVAAPGYQEYCGHQHKIRQRAAEWVQCCEGFYTPYRSFPDRSGRSYKDNFQVQQNNVAEFSPNRANAQRSQQAEERIRQALAHLQAINTLPRGVSARAAAIIATVKELTGVGMSLSTLHRPSNLSLWHPGQQKSLEPAQGALVQAVLDKPIHLESLEPAQGALVQATPLYEGVGLDERLPQTPQRVGGKQPLIQPLEQEGESEGENLPSSAPTAPERPTAPAASKIPTAADPALTRRFTRIWLAATRHAEKLVRQQLLIEGHSLSYQERSRRETIAKMRFLWDSGEPLLMDEVRVWAAANPGILPEVQLVEASARPFKNLASTNAVLLPSFDPPHLKVGDRVRWENCPGHCSWANPFTITAIENGLAWLDLYSKPVPLSELKLPY